jgi:hypothetical protein
VEIREKNSIARILLWGYKIFLFFVSNFSLMLIDDIPIEERLSGVFDPLSPCYWFFLNFFFNSFNYLD